MKRIVMATVLCLLMALLAVPNAAKADTGTVEGCIRFSSASPFSVGTYFQDWNGTIEYSQDGNTWTTWDGSDVDATFDGTLYTLSLRGIGNTKLSSMNRMKIFKLDGTAISCDGNIENLLDYQKVANNQHPGMASYCFSGLFVDCTSLVKAPELPATKLASYCYESMFYNCASLTEAPALPATELADNCYSTMFVGCKSLTGAPELPAKKLTMGCYNGMFVNCTSLVTPPALPATELQIGCYNSMFAGCASLTTAPALPAKKRPCSVIT